MSIHQYNPNQRPDSDFINGEHSLLSVGNICRLLDGRRTPGIIEHVDFKSGMFTWKITDFEDKDKHWVVPFEKVVNYQFDKDSIHLSIDQTNEVKETITKYDKPLIITACERQREKNETTIEAFKEEAILWLKEHSSFLLSKQTLDFNSNIGSKELSRDLINYLKTNNLEQLEAITADYFVLNPNSGEWIKGMSILLAEMGLVNYNGKIIRTKDIFEGLGSKELRKSYLLHRLAFNRAIFSILNIDAVPLYRGMCSEIDWRPSTNTFVSFTFNNSVAQSFSGFDGETKYKNAYFLKATVPVTKLFMTYLETSQMNERYKEAEALLFNDLNITF